MDVVGYIVSQGKYADVFGCVGFCYEDHEELVIVVVPFEFCREANKKALTCDTVDKNIDYHIWLYDQIERFRTGEEQYLNQSTPQKGVIV